MLADERAGGCSHLRQRERSGNPQREAVAERVLDAKDDDGIETVRAALQSLFEGFVVYDAPTQPDAVKSYRIVPKLRAAVTAARLGVRAEIGETAVVA